MIYAVMLVALGFYIYLPEWLNPHASTRPGKPVFYAVTAAAVADLLIMFIMRRRMIVHSARVLAGDPENKAVLGRWRAGHIVSFALCIAVGLYGLVLRFIGFTLSDVAPFYLAGLVAMLYSFPRDPSGDTVGNPISRS
jgi:hypothetical protein